MAPRPSLVSRNALQIDYVDPTALVTTLGTCIRFTFLWTDDNHWEGQNYSVTVVERVVLVRETCAMIVGPVERS
jgi:hypothetical protein